VARAGIEAFYLPAEAGPGERFCIHHQPAPGVAVRGAFVYLHPFAEEMSKSRRMAAMQARALADAGWAVLQIDLAGCGDSSGDLADAGWDGWLGDALQAHRWLSAAHGVVPGFWGLRAGCLLAAEAARTLAEPVDHVYWSPVWQGKQVLAQFLRLKTAAAIVSGERRDVGDDPKQALARGETVEIAGYRLPPAVAQGLERATLAPPAAGRHGLWFEVDPRPEAQAELSPATVRALDAWKPAHATLHAARVTGPAFWQTQEIEDAPALIAATVAAVGAWSLQ
jgi:exosortase A-associated hydrolase 2